MRSRALVLSFVALAACSRRQEPITREPDPRETGAARLVAPVCVPPDLDRSALDRLSFRMTLTEARQALAAAGLCVEGAEQGKGPGEHLRATAAAWKATVYYDRGPRDAMSSVAVTSEDAPAAAEAERELLHLRRRFGKEPRVESVGAYAIWENATTRLIVEVEGRGERWSVDEQWLSTGNGPVCKRGTTDAGFRALPGFRGVPWRSTYAEMQRILAATDVTLGPLVDEPDMPNPPTYRTGAADADVRAGASRGFAKFEARNGGPLGLDYVDLRAADPPDAPARDEAEAEARLGAHAAAYGPPCSGTRSTVHAFEDAETAVSLSVQRVWPEGVWRVHESLRPVGR